VLLPLVKAWVAAGKGDLVGALEMIAPLESLKGLGAFHAMHAGLLQDFVGRVVAAEESYEKALDEAVDPSLRMHEIVANFYLRLGRTADARAVHDRYVAATGAPDQIEPLIAAIDEPGPIAPSVGGVAAGIAESLLGIATLVSQDNVGDRASMYAHLALSLRPDLAIARMLIAEILANQGRDEDALAAYRRVPLDSLFGWQARREAAEALTRLDRVEEAIADLESMIEAKPKLSAAAVSLGNVLRAEKRFAEAASAYDTAIGRLGNVTAEHWLLFIYRGVARERGKQWEPAEQDFLRALELKPDQPHALNYLAYSWVEQGRNFDKALEMLQKAVDQRPDDGYIVDSLGWVYQRLGQYDKAVELLERAIELKPQDPVINDHLGDAYWRVGRKLEARFQWRRALFFEPEPDQVAPIETKIEAGLADGPSDG
jgi:tetratricopeptide (TPR) repeat protein